MAYRSHLVTSLLIPLSAAVLAGACGDNIEGPQPDAAPLPGDVTSPGVGIAVVNSDFSSTSISLLDPTGQVRNGDCINSGTRPPASTLALSGDVGLPSWPQPDHSLVVIDHGNGTLTWLDPATCAVQRQLDVSTGFFANPHDVIGVSPTKAYVTRYGRNLNPTAADHLDVGDDLLIIDPSVPAITGRIDLATYAVEVTGKAIQARPDRARLIGGKLFVLLNNIDGLFKAMGHGRVVVIDTATDQVASTVEIPDLANCGGLSYVERTKTLVVACGGDFNADQAATSGLAYIDVTASPPALVRSQPAPFGGRVLAGYAGTPDDGVLGFGVTPGGFGPGDPPDQLWVQDVPSREVTMLDDAGGSFVFGTVLDDPGHHRLFLTDATDDAPRVHVYDYTDAGAPMRTASVNASPTVGLPPREIAWY
jgi:hypothetical protein